MRAYQDLREFLSVPEQERCSTPSLNTRWRR
jgi:hypothetical protein